MNKGLFRCTVILLVMVLLQGCAFFKLKEDLQMMKTSAAISGEIQNRSAIQGPLTVILYDEAEGERQIRNIQVLAPPEHFFFFLVPVGDYYIAAFQDANLNLSYDEGETFGLYGQPDRVHIEKPKAVDDLNFEISRTSGFPPGFPNDLSTVTISGDKVLIAFGKTASLQDPIFSEEYAKMGFWQPITFLKQVGVGAFFLEAYDPDKTPILFVHGAAGSPRNFKAIVAHIDRSRYQPWFFYYPSAIPLEKVSRFLNNLVKELHKKYHFKQLFVTGHSMGGLVARGFILKNLYDDDNDYIKLFVSISSPFGGLETAQKGVESAPVAIPSWHDVAPGSEYIDTIFSRPLKEKLDSYLLFSYKGDCSMFMDNNDGAVTIRSQLDPRAQDDAIEKWGFDVGHVEILSSPQFLEEYNSILEKTTAKEKGILPAGMKQLFGTAN